MIGFRITTRPSFDTVSRKAKRANYQNLQHAAAALRLTARRSLHRRKKPSPAGQPPGSPTGRLRRSILYAVNRRRQHALIGPDRTRIGIAAAEHEHGGKWRRERFPRRPFMGPAFEKTRPRLARRWAGSIR